jgi:osmoprotectant transport system ATP-binding protein
VISFRGVSKSFDSGRSFAVRGVSLEVAEGETLVLLGSSGSGKTTLLKTVNRLVPATEGTVLVDGDDTALMDPVDLRRSIGYVFQGIGLFPHLSVEANVCIVPRLLGWSSTRTRTRAGELLELVGLDPGTYSGRLPRQLSGGEQQRVGVARALAADPSQLLMDEPFGALDAVTRDDLQRGLLALRRRLRKTILFVTHDIFEAIRLGDRIGVLHQGRLEQIATPAELLRRPATAFVAELAERAREQLRSLGALLD